MLILRGIQRMGIKSLAAKIKKAVRKKRIATGNERWINYYKEADRKFLKRRYDKVKNIPIDPNLIFFESFLGRTVADSPLAIFNEIVDDPAYEGYHFIWSVNDVNTHADLERNSRVKLVKRLSEQYYSGIATAKYVINNITNNILAPKKEGQIYIQTWHGTPLKRLGLDIALDGNGLKTRSEIHEQYRREADTFDYLLSPSAYVTEKLSSAFGLTEEEKKNKVVELGYPRNSALFTCTDEERAAIKRTYGIPADKKVILYCTTWREQTYKEGEGFKFDVELDLEELYNRLSDTACVVMRMHYNHKSTVIDFEAYKGFLINGTAIDDINLLFSVADVLVTDYSSVMFDYANLRRPMIFYMYDRDRYENEIRGFYFDASELPGPIVRSQGELEDELCRVLGEEFVPDGKYKAFNAKFNYLDDADATRRVVDRLLPKKEKPDPVSDALVKYLEACKKKAARTEKLQRLKEKPVIRSLTFPVRAAEAMIKYYLEPAIRTGNMYARSYRRIKVRKNTILYESFSGEGLTGDPFELFTEALNDMRLADYRHIWTVDGEEKAAMLRNRYKDDNRVSFVVRDTRAYMDALSGAAYLINNGEFPYYFTKKKDQVYINTCFINPSKKSGYDAPKGRTECSNKVRNLLIADYILSSGPDHTEILKKSFKLDGLYNGKIIEEGSLRPDDNAVPKKMIDAVLFKNEDGCKVKTLENGKKKLFLSRGQFGVNGISTSLLNIMRFIDHDRYDVTLMIEKGPTDPVSGMIERIDPRVRVIYRTMMPPMTVCEGIDYKIRRALAKKNVFSKAMAREWTRNFGDIEFDTAVDFSGYIYLNTLLMAMANARHKCIWLHNDMMAEFALKHSELAEIFKLYRFFDHVVACGDEIMRVNASKVPAKYDMASRLTRAGNTIDCQRILKMAEEEPVIPICDTDPNGVKYTNFLTIGRMSPEKNHFALIRAFKRFHEKYPASRLYILGNGKLKKQTDELVAKLGLKNRVFTPGNVANPYALLKRCSCFILPSVYEGLPMTVYEARVLHKPVIMSDFSSVTDCCLENGQLVIGNREDDILNGMIGFMEGKVPCDYVFDGEQYNLEKVKEFYQAVFLE